MTWALLLAPLVSGIDHGPDGVTATLARLPEGEILLLPAPRQLVAGRPMVGWRELREGR